MPENVAKKDTEYTVKELLGQADFGRAFLAEFLGTALFVFIGPGAALAGSDALGIALAFGLTISILIYAFGHHSGGHFNPAVTLSFVLLGTIHWARAVAYMFAQFAGAILGALLLWGAVVPEISGAANEGLLGVTNRPAENVSLGRAFLLETILTFLLVLVVLEVAVNRKTSAGTLAPVAIGWAVAVAHIVAIPITGCGINPARSLGPAAVAGDVQDLW
ncbi:MAG: hypothetical protein SGCHY_002634, partial [Lobulomycetales sp.]